MIHRIAISEKYNASLHEIENLWSLDDLADAHALLDALEDAQAKAMPKPKRRR